MAAGNCNRCGQDIVGVAHEDTSGEAVHFSVAACVTAVQSALAACERERDEADANAHQWHAAADLATKDAAALRTRLARAEAALEVLADRRWWADLNGEIVGTGESPDGNELLTDVGHPADFAAEVLAASPAAQWVKVEKNTAGGVHGQSCVKAHHGNATGLLHGPDDDGPFDVDGVVYCGRCHLWMGASPAAPSGGDEREVTP